MPNTFLNAGSALFATKLSGDHETRSHSWSSPHDQDSESCTCRSSALIEERTVRSQYFVMAILEFLAKIYGRSGDHSERLFQSDVFSVLIFLSEFK